MRGLGKIHFSVSLIYLNSEVSTLYEIELICRLNFKLLDLEINYVLFSGIVIIPIFRYFRISGFTRYFKLRIFNPTKFTVLKYLRSTTLGCKDIGIRKFTFCKNSITFLCPKIGIITKYYVVDL